MLFRHERYPWLFPSEEMQLSRLEDQYSSHNTAGTGFWSAQLQATPIRICDMTYCFDCLSFFVYIDLYFFILPLILFGFHFC